MANGTFLKTRFKDFGVLSLIDSGNARGALMSARLAQKCNLKVEETTSRAAGVAGQNIKILGVVKNVSFKVEEIDEEFSEDFYIIENMTVPCNLGSDWLTKHKVKTMFKDSGNQIELNNKLVTLVPKNKFLVKNLISTVINKVEENKQSYPKINVANLMEQKWVCESVKKMIIPAESTVTMEVKIKGKLPKGQLVYIAPKQGYCSRNKLLVNEGITEVGNEGRIVSKVTNFDKYERSIPAGTLVGHLFLAESVNMLQERREKEDVSTTLKKIRFIKKKLKLDDAPLLKNNIALRGKVVGLFLKNFRALSVDPTDIGSCTLEEYDIKLIPNAEPFKNRMIRLNPHHAEKLKEQIDLWLETDVIEECNSPYNSAIFAVKKKTGTTNEVKVRFVLDYRSLNAITEKICYPLPKISELFDKIGGKKIFTSIDLTSAYNSMHLKESAKPYTAFCTSERQYCFKRLPFGLTNAPSAFVRLMDRVMDLSPELRTFCLVYLDDVLIYSDNVEEHLRHLDLLLQTFCKANLKLNLGKCSLFAKEVKFLGHIINENGIHMDRSYIQKIKDWPRPETGKEVQKFAGFLNYYGSYFKDFSEITAPLNKYRQSSEIKWSEEDIKSFELAKELFCQEVSKAYPDWRMEAEPFVLDTDWSSTAMSAILSQKQNGIERMINCWSRVCSKHESNYSAHKGELCALVHAVESFECYLRHRPFIVRTDSAALKHLDTWRQKGYFLGLTIRWINFLATFEYTVVHRAGKKHTNVDILSRIAMPNTNEQNSKLSYDEYGEQILDTVYQLDNPKIALIAGLSASKAAEIHSRVRARTFAKSLAKDEVLIQVKDYIINNVKPSANEMGKMPYRGRAILRFYDHLSFKDGLIILTTPVKSQREFIFAERVIVPISLYRTVFMLAHTGLTGGHRGVQETLSKINRHFVMPYVNKYVHAAVASCITCLNRRKKGAHNHTITNSPLAGEAMSEIAMDSIGPLTPCEFNGIVCRHILILIDSYSRYVWLYPIADVTAETIVNCLKVNFFSVMGCCDRLRSDNATSFKSKLFKEV
ncbi:MAG: hypothetical protein GY777_20315, partial [Candidatus Brocadiaceae bacterium]|nr:hypothetical protein [Candidatus Brocadiaceae bacterium]